MTAIGDYAISIIITAFICSIVSDLVQEPAANAIVRMIGGMILTITIVTPVFNLDFASVYEYDRSYKNSASAAAERGLAISRNALRARIKQETESYIQEKAETMNAHVFADVSLSDDAPPVPVFAVISGSVSPSAKQKLQIILETQLGITKENQQWTE